MIPKTEEELKWWKQGVIAMLIANFSEYARCSEKDEEGFFCGDFDCLGQAITIDVVNSIIAENWPDKIEDNLQELYKAGESFIDIYAKAQLRTRLL